MSEPIENSLNINEIQVKDILLLIPSIHAALTKCGLDFIFLENFVTLLPEIEVKAT